MGSINKCNWCGAETTNKEMYTAMSFGMIIQKVKLMKNY